MALSFSASFVPWRDASPSELEDGITPRRRDRKGKARVVAGGVQGGCWFTRGFTNKLLPTGLGGLLVNQGGLATK
jgi:hypothetical protein